MPVNHVETLELEESVRKAHWEFFDQLWHTYIDLVCSYTRISAEFVYRTRNCFYYNNYFSWKDAR